MKINVRRWVQSFFSMFVIISMVFYFLYIQGRIAFKIFSIGDLNPYGGFHALKLGLTDFTYRFRGITRSMALTIGISVLALFRGSFFCLYICPIGALQDFFGFFSSKLGMKPIKIHKGVRTFLNRIKYFVLLLLLVLSFLDLSRYIAPFSPWNAYLNLFFGAKLSFGFFVLMVILALSLLIKRPFCNFSCPLGAYQELVGAVACTKKKATRGLKYKGMALALFIGLVLFLPLSMQTRGGVRLEDVKDGRYIGEGIGFGGPLQLEVLIENAKVKEIQILSHRETTGYYEEVFYQMKQQIIKEDLLIVDAISGATASSKGFRNAFLDAIRKGYHE